jgi:DNA-damage-inducible protein D
MVVGKFLRTLHNNEWWFSVVDVVAALTDSVNARDYWFKMKIREKDEAGIDIQ